MSASNKTLTQVPGRRLEINRLRERSTDGMRRTKARKVPQPNPAQAASYSHMRSGLSCPISTDTETAAQDVHLCTRFLRARSCPIAPLWVAPLHPVYVRGQAYLMLHQGKEAAAEYQKFLDHPGAVGNFPLGALARLGLARAYAMQGEPVKAR